MDIIILKRIQNLDFYKNHQMTVSCHRCHLQIDMSDACVHKQNWEAV